MTCELLRRRNAAPRERPEAATGLRALQLRAAARSELSVHERLRLGRRDAVNREAARARTIPCATAGVLHEALA